MAERLRMRFSAFFILLLALGKGTHAETCSASDNISLMYFMLEVVYGGQAFSTWTYGTDCCSWKGVTCNSAGRVEVLNIVASDTPAPAPKATSYMVGTGLGGLSELTSLTLKNISLNGALPPSWGNIKNLNVLDVEQCDIVGSIPDEYCNWSSIKTLNLKNNLLNGTVPNCISSLPALTLLDLSGNLFSGYVPSKGK